MGSTNIDLVKDLQAKLDSPLCPEGELNAKKYEDGIKAIIAHARIGYFHDFASPLATPKIELHKRLLEIGLGDLDQKMQHGEYDDESPEDKL